MAKSKSVNTKLLQTTVMDFCKLYNIDLTDSEASLAKEEIEKSLVQKIKSELDKYEN